MNRRTHGAWFARIGLVVVLLFVVSGIAASGSATAAESKPCGEQRGACDFGCPPTCGDGGCARMLPAVLGKAPEWLAPRASERWLRDELAPPAPPPLDGVFHPPIR